MVTFLSASRLRSCLEFTHAVAPHSNHLICAPLVCHLHPSLVCDGEVANDTRGPLFTLDHQRSIEIQAFNYQTTPTQYKGRSARNFHC